MSYISYNTYIKAEGAELFTLICLPRAIGTFPTVVYRSPYVDYAENMTDAEIEKKEFERFGNFLQNGYAVVYQHCRGRGKSSGDCVPYIYEREDGLLLREWIRKQPFYNGELYLFGRSYTSSVHFVTTPFESDVKAAVLEVQDPNRYNCNYRNGFYKMGLHGGWYIEMYKNKTMRHKKCDAESYNMLPLSDFSKTVFDEPVADFDEILRHPDRNDPFWNTRFGGGEAKDAIKHANIPILLITGFYDLYTGGVFDTWFDLDAETKSKSALIVHPYDHNCIAAGQPVVFDNSNPLDEFGDYRADWFNFARGLCKAPVETGKVTYYKIFGDAWCTDDFNAPEKKITFTLGEGERTYRYNPYAPAKFKGGLSTNFGGNAWQDKPNSRYDILSFFSPEFTEDTFIKGKISAKLTVKSSCEDTCFYVRLSLEKPEGYYGLRDDINQISAFCENYTPGNEVEMDFSFDEHAFVVKKGERLRVDVSSSAFPLYVRHTNNKGLFSEQTTAKVADNTVILDKSSVTLFFE